MGYITVQAFKLSGREYMYSKILVILGALSLATAAFAADYDVDPAHSHVGFTVKHLVGKVPGEFKDYTGKFSFDDKKPAIFSANFTIKTASISTGNEKRDEHMKSPDFFDVKKFPEITFVSTSFKSSGAKKYKLLGNVTMHGVTKPVTFDVEYMGAEKDPWGNMRAGFTATTKVDRKDFGIIWNKTLDSGGLMVGNDVSIELNIEATQTAAKK